MACSVLFANHSLLRLALSCGLFGLLLTGCSPPPRPSFDSPKDAQPSPDALRAEAAIELQQDAGDIVPLTTLPLPWESWHAYYIRGNKVGFIHVTNRIDSPDLEKQLKTTIHESLRLRRGDTQFIQSVKQQGWEKLDGSLISFNAESKIGPSVSRYRGEVKGDQLVITSSRSLGNRNLPWKPYYRGLTAVQQSLLAKPLQLNQTRRFRELMPVYYQVALVELSCQNRASITTLDDKVHDALEIDLTISVEGQSLLTSTLWTDDQGRLLKSYTPAADLTAIACTREQALEPFRATVDAMSVLALPVTGVLEQPAKATTTSFLLRPKKAAADAQSVEAIQPSAGQWVKTDTDGSIQIQVSTDAKELSQASDYQTLDNTATAEDREPNSLINSNDPAVRRLAQLSRAEQPRQVALDLTKSVQRLIQPGDYSRGFATASQTANDGVGDCSERALLLAAMLRARDIPSRVVAGLVYVPSSTGSRMAYHMWTIAYLDDQWIALDGTLGTLAPADRIAIATSSLSDENEARLLDPLLSFAGQYTVEILPPNSPTDAPETADQSDAEQ